jgi:quercetin dioxygenase-like cupin family protein
VNYEAVKRVLVCAMPVGPIGAPVIAQQAVLKVTPVQSVDFPPGFTTESYISELAPGNCADRHTHSGIETDYVIEGAILLKVAGKPDQIIKAGESYQTPARVPHYACTVPDQVFKVLGIQVLEKGKPLASPAP